MDLLRDITLMTGESSTCQFPAARTGEHRRPLLILLLLTCGTIMAMDRADPDLWGHIQYGRELIRDRALPETSTWNYTAVGYRWINHENLSEIVLAATYDTFGAWGLSTGKLILSLLVIGLMFWSQTSDDERETKGTPDLLATLWFVGIVVALGMEIHWHFRPQTVGYTCAACLLALLNRALPWAVNGDQFQVRKTLWLAVPILFVWANSHGGFLAGLCILWAYCGMMGLHLMATTRLARIGDLVQIALVAVSASAVTLINPYGLGLHLWLFEIFQVPFSEIDDWSRLSLLSLEAVGFWLMLATTLTCAWMNYGSVNRSDIPASKKLHWPALLLILMVGAQAVMHVRHLPFLAMTWGFFIVRPLNQLFLSFAADLSRQTSTNGRTTSGQVSIRWSPRWAAVTCMWAVFIGLHLGRHLSMVKVDRDQYPVDALAYMHKHGLEGRTVVTFNWAQYAIGLFAERGMNSTVNFDGRFNTCYPQTVIDAHFDFIFGKEYNGPRHRSPESPPVDPERVLRDGNPELVVVSRLQKPSVRTMQRNAADWTLLYQDGLAQVWGRKSLFDDPSSMRYIPVEDRSIIEERPSGYVAFPAFPQHSPPADRALASQ